jgi:capsule polysaccharide export protein KpsE/RkpR
VLLETRNDGINNQRCLYLDRTFTENAPEIKFGIANLESMRRNILNKEQELVAISDAQKITAKDMKSTHNIITIAPVDGLI